MLFRIVLCVYSILLSCLSCRFIVQICFNVLSDGIFFFFKQKTAYEMLRSLVGSEMCIRDSASQSLSSSESAAGLKPALGSCSAFFSSALSTAAFSFFSADLLAAASEAACT
eukprot:TRINITY_DN15600_c0_g1_i1.p2 TRINITY_DN15600_c0_g1~~TRINITY_DN15600_c0_g1_i1.p2  ORF type:complete len:112 (+),score=30.20 TRINITY_DN15600_c0_g1_i1:27-362(+)